MKNLYLGQAGDSGNAEKELEKCIINLAGMNNKLMTLFQRKQQTCHNTCVAFVDKRNRISKVSSELLTSNPNPNKKLGITGTNRIESWWKVLKKQTKLNHPTHSEDKAAVERANLTLLYWMTDHNANPKLNNVDLSSSSSSSSP